MIEITEKPISPELVINKAKTGGSGCVATYIGLIREYSRGKQVLSVEYQDLKGEAASRLREIVGEAKQRWQMENSVFTHRIGKLRVGDVNLVIAVASAHRQEGFAACQYIIDRFKQIIPTHKTETYQDGSTWVEGE